jgi:hypothetical protein
VLRSITLGESAGCEGTHRSSEDEDEDGSSDEKLVHTANPGVVVPSILIVQDVQGDRE